MGNYTPRGKSTYLTKGKEIVKRRTSSKAELSYNEIKEMKYLPKKREETENLSITKENFSLRLRSLNSGRKPKRIAR
ncbi:hypothetical protein M9H77_28051 [Catharanthus roseus]|uniref:Uncharacterized protein n=1 Tax=Catharanthus roseus TaxID=4058 RepID=A0ACC0AII8_CATRO|nr:hypothetical protein M9H77_28051 [Catharanthus roseus]